MISVGIFNGYFPYTLDESIKRIKEHGFTCVQLDLCFKDMALDWKELDVARCHKIRDAFRVANLPIVCISGYTNLVHPDAVQRKNNIDYLKTLLRHARDLGTPYVISETGTFNRESDWVFDPRNATEEAYQEIKGIIADLTQYAHEHGAVFLVENYIQNIIGSVNQLLRLFDDIQSPGLGLLLDPTNYFTEHNIDDVDGELNRIFNALGDRVKIAHAKDIKRAEDTGEKHAAIDASEAHSFRGVGAVELPAPGLGILNYDLYLKRLAERHPNIPIIIEHLDESDVPRAKKFLDGKLQALGV
ncbi:MAG: sugar phosphate isomerase/epimerase [Propionivibrio sp.]